MPTSIPKTRPPPAPTALPTVVSGTPRGGPTERERRKGNWRVVGLCPTPWQGEARPAPPARPADVPDRDAPVGAGDSGGTRDSGGCAPARPKSVSQSGSPACGSTPLICSQSAKSAVSLRRIAQCPPNFPGHHCPAYASAQSEMRGERTHTPNPMCYSIDVSMSVTLLIFVSPIPPDRGPEAIRPGPFFVTSPAPAPPPGRGRSGGARRRIGGGGRGGGRGWRGVSGPRGEGWGGG